MFIFSSKMDLCYRTCEHLLCELSCHKKFFIKCLDQRIVLWIYAQTIYSNVRRQNEIYPKQNAQFQEEITRCRKLRRTRGTERSCYVLFYLQRSIGRTKSFCDVRRLQRAVSVNRRAVWQIEFLMSRERRAPI